MELFHISWATHNSRISERMEKYNVKPNLATVLSEKDEVQVTRYIAEVVREDKLRMIAYNICADHVHMIIACEAEERDRIVRKLKSVSARKFNFGKGYSHSEKNLQQGGKQHCSMQDSQDSQQGGKQHCSMQDSQQGGKQHCSMQDSQDSQQGGKQHCSMQDSQDSQQGGKQHCSMQDSQQGGKQHCSMQDSQDSQQGGKQHCSKEERERRGKTQQSLWQQKYNWTCILNDEQLEAVYDYVKNNRIKHGLPENEVLSGEIEKMCSGGYLEEL
jgi:REP element-mobilizing transposase RayT